MNIEITPKYELYKALGYTILLMAFTIPLSILGIQLLNFVLGGIRV